MRFASNHNRAERAAELIAASCFGAAVAIALFKLMPPAGGWSAVAALAGGVAAGSAIFALIAQIPAQALVLRSFEPSAFAQRQDELLLDQPLATVAESRATAVFAAEPAEMIARIGTFLDSGSGVSRRGAPLRTDASAELHSALADIRRSLGRARSS